MADTEGQGQPLQETGGDDDTKAGGTTTTRGQSSQDTKEEEYKLEIDNTADIKAMCHRAIIDSEVLRDQATHTHTFTQGQWKPKLLCGKESDSITHPEVNCNMPWAVVELTFGAAMGKTMMTNCGLVVSHTALIASDPISMEINMQNGNPDKVSKSVMSFLAEATHWLSGIQAQHKERGVAIFANLPYQSANTEEGDGNWLRGKSVPALAIIKLLR